MGVKKGDAGKGQRRLLKATQQINLIYGSTYYFFYSLDV